MNPPAELRAVCESLMKRVHQRDLPNRDREIVLCLQNLYSHIESNGVLDPYIEYVLIPLFLLHPSDADKTREVPERIREETLKCIRAVVDRNSSSFRRRADLFFPAFLRGISTLTDVNRDGQLAVNLKEETKLEAVRMLNSLITTQEGLNAVENHIVFHYAALLLDISVKERSKELRAEALAAFLNLVRSLTAEQVDFIFPGAASSLCEVSGTDFKAGPLVHKLAIDALRECILAVLNDKRVESSELVDAVAHSALNTNSHPYPQESDKIQRSTTVHTKSGQNYFDRLLPLMDRIWLEDSGMQVSASVRLAKAKLASTILQHCSKALGKNASARLTLLRQLILACSDEEESVRQPAETEFSILTHSQPESISFQIGLELERLLLEALLNMSKPSVSEEETILENNMAVCIVLLKHIDPKHIRTQFEGSQRRILWSMLLTFKCEPARFAQLGVLEFSRFSSSRARFSATRMFEIIRSRCPNVAESLMDALLYALDDLLDAEADSEVSHHEEDQTDVLRVPRSCLPQLIYICNELAVDGDTLLDRLMSRTDLWSLPTQSLFKACSPQDASFNVLARAAALSCVSSCAKQRGVSFRVRLSGALYPVLQSVADGHPGLKLASEACLSQIAVSCAYDTVPSMLQANVDYIVDAIIRRLPQFSKNDLSFADVIEALIDRIPIWSEGEVESPWIQDLVHTILDGLDDRASAPQVAWSLLRIAQAVVTRAANVAPVATLKKVERIDINVHDARVDDAILELTEWIHPRNQDVVGAKESETDAALAENEDDTRQDHSHPLSNMLEAIERIMGKCAIFVSDPDVLVRQQAAKVLSQCITALADAAPEKARTSVHQIWSVIVEQVKEEKHPATLSLLLDLLTVAASSSIGAEFFTRKFSDEAWPVLQSILERTAAPLSKKQKSASFRDYELSKRILRCLPTLGVMLVPRAEEIAIATSRFTTTSRSDGEAKELGRLAGEVWTALARVAGDVIWLPLAILLNKVSLANSLRKPNILFNERNSASDIWTLLESQ